MRAIALTHYLPIDHPAVFQEYTMETPTPKSGELLVALHACAVNPIDAKLRAPKEKIESTPRILGWDAAGTVVALGDGVDNFAIGDSVYYAGSLSLSGANATHQCIPAQLVAHMPNTITYAEAAAMPLTTLTAWELLFDSMGIPLDSAQANTGKSILIINGAGGVGSIAIQLAKWAGLNVVATASRETSARWCQNLGADLTVNWQSDLINACQQAGYTGFDYIACLTDSQAYWQDMAQLIHPFGAIGLITSAKGPVDINLFKEKSVRLCWEFMFARAERPALRMKHREILAEVSALLDIGVLRSTINHRLTGLSVDSLRQAHALMESGQAIGKCVIDFADAPN